MVRSSRKEESVGCLQNRQLVAEEAATIYFTYSTGLSLRFLTYLAFFQIACIFAKAATESCIYLS